jgi:MFS family permease
MVGGTEVERTHGSLRSRCVMYGLISGFEMANYVTRLALGPLVAFIVRDGLFTEAQRALMLNSFTPGYVLTQIPAGWLIQRVGCKPVILMNSVGIVSIMLLLPLAARRGASAVSMCLFSFGVLQSSFAPALWTIKASWIPQGPERAWALMASGMGKCWPPSGDALLAF